LLKVINTPETTAPEEVFTLPDIVNFGWSACVTVTSLGLPVAPVAVTRMVAVRDEVLVLAVKLQLMVPESVPLAPDVIVSQLPDITDALHGMVPVPVFETQNVVVPASFATA
jgi:hypothetical protein